jgi:hypothetical protein
VYALNSIRTPDGTVLVSRHRHDYVSHTDKNGEIYFVDGGHDYLHRSTNKEQAEDLSVSFDDNFDKVREVFEWGTYGKDGKQPLTYVKLKDMEVGHIKAVLVTQNLSSLLLNIFLTELEYKNYV